MLVLITVNSEPARAQVALYDNTGKCRGVYLNQGQFRLTACAAIDVDGDGREELCLGGCNNRLDAAVMTVLNADSVRGVSPPWDTPYFINSRMPKGSQRYYLSLPKTAMTAGQLAQSSVRQFQWDKSRGLVMFIRDYLDWGYDCQLDTNFVPSMVSFSDGQADLWAARFGRHPNKVVCDSLLALVRIWRDTVQIGVSPI